MCHVHYASPLSRPRHPTRIVFAKPRWLVGLIALLMAFATHANTPSFSEQTISPSPSKQSPADSVKTFMEWRQRLSNGEHHVWKDYLGPLQGQPLFAYLQYLQLNAELSDFSGEELEQYGSYDRSIAFMEVWPEIHVADNLNRQLIRRLGKEQQWRRLLDQAIDSPPTDIRCLQLRAEYALASRPKSAIFADAKKIWLRGASQPNRCDPIFAQLKEQGQLRPRDLQQRARNAIVSGNLSLAKWLNKQLNKHDQDNLKPWFQLRADPRRLKHLLTQIKTQDRLELSRHAMHWLAGRYPDEAEALWNKFVGYAKPSEPKKAALWRRLALKAARDNHPNAVRWLQQTQLADSDSYGWGWYMRALINNQAWPALAAMADRQLDVDSSTRRGIQYWSAMALNELGLQMDANRLLRPLAKERHWYGMLAADQLRQDYPAPDPLPKSDPINRSLLLSHINARRARDLHHAGLNWLARGEWSQLMKTIPNTLHQEAALFARDIDWPSMASRTQAVFTPSHVSETLFPFAWEDLVAAAAEEHQILRSHIWSQMRSESLFMPDAGSGAGAVGLMQLMPATAKSMGREMKLRNWRRLPLRQPATNIHLGSKYIAKMLERFDNQIILAAAAYNAGPHRVDRWLAQREYNDPTLWAEMIPFTETRGYVQRTLYHFAMYQRRIDDKPVRLSQLLDIDMPFAVANRE